MLSFVCVCVCVCSCVCVCVPRLLQLQRAVLSPDSEVSDELLYGRAGYLYALLYVNKEISPNTVDEGTITKVTHTHTHTKTLLTVFFGQ